MSTLRHVILLILLIAVILFANLLVHEFGHCLTMNVTGGACGGVYIWPGVKIWPLAQAGERYEGTWDNYFGLTQYERSPATDFAGGLVSLMGSGSVAILASLALLLLWIFTPGGWLQTALLIQAFCFVDLPLYAILPALGMRHYLFFGGTYAEPLEGAIQMGIPANVFIPGVLAYSALMLAGWLLYLRRIRNSNT